MLYHLHNETWGYFKFNLEKYVHICPWIGALRQYVYCHVLEDKLHGTMFQLNLIPLDMIFQ
jgi:hypothetical protein